MTNPASSAPASISSPISLDISASLNTVTSTTPCALNQTSSGTVNMRWFVEYTEYDPCGATFQPLINGENAFRRIYDAILSANHTVDIICWGFQPSMYFRRDGTGMKIGELLEHVGKTKNVKVRLLCWEDPTHLAELNENNMPGNSVLTGVKAGLKDATYAKHPTTLAKDYQTDDERKFDTEWYWRANLNNVTSPGLLATVVPIDAARSAYFKKQAIKNLDFATRGFSTFNRAEIAWYTFWHGKDKKRDLQTKAENSATMGLTAPTHHQKMVLVDYEDPENAVGFVMGHNMLDQYWDTSAHSCTPKTPSTGRNGPYPWQDMSSFVTGPALQYLNENFCEAWDDATGQNLTKARKGLKTRLKLKAGVTPLMAQVLRTQSQKGKRDIEKLYLRAANNVAQHIFIQNQYFRWVPLADAIKATAKKQYGDGRDAGKHGPIYLFVITNSSDAAIAFGTVNTYRMLDALGQAKDIPGVASLELDDARQADLKKQLADVSYHQQDANNDLLGAMEIQGDGDSPAAAQQLADAKQKVAQLKQQRAHIESQMKSAPPEAMNRDYPGLKVQICTLVAPDSPPGKWVDIYVHAKVMTVDDAFTTLGSANINNRSMEGDSELNICHVDGDTTKLLRQDLWGLHTAGRGVDDNPTEAFNQWTKIVDRNADNQNKHLAPVASLVGFMRTSNVRTYVD
ncbi:phospholipase D-like domain-containing protein [Paraburkholderia megapolitana]|uniref:PLD-like domain-containing protein n=1 Tax=Paraburkholderia megapolitana TaxID=420953 RepID=A0A1I3U977_9BURK|nr:phospholipase D-like domain-containing protein [Paraburkholderia megapolitana]QDQ83658.1 phosphatidylserine/phosphatidylglycerophosphate/cardiolipin synthase family protein [Paraburkholderia megapolitana]SFJ78311.1 PLD-like domain-containing protein [Paraburkholderia megapolitana]